MTYRFFSIWLIFFDFLKSRSFTSSHRFKPILLDCQNYKLHMMLLYDNGVGKAIVLLFSL